jgi:hypothetical protein
MPVSATTGLDDDVGKVASGHMAASMGFSGALWGAASPVW